VADQEARVRELEQRVRELEVKLRSFVADTSADDLGGKSRTITYTYMMDPKIRSRRYRLSVDHNDGSPQLRFEEV
jgi:hypothetical protein